MNEQKLIYAKGTVFSTKQEATTFILLNDVFLADEKNIDTIYTHKIHRPYESHVFFDGKVILMSSYLFEYCNLITLTDA
jgi:hypothetical protein